VPTGRNDCENKRLQAPRARPVPRGMAQGVIAITKLLESADSGGGRPA